MLKAASKKCPCRCSVGRVQPEDSNQTGEIVLGWLVAVWETFSRPIQGGPPTSYKWIVTPINGLINGSPRV